MPKERWSGLTALIPEGIFSCGASNKLTNVGRNLCWRSCEKGMIPTGKTCIKQWVLNTCASLAVYAACQLKDRHALLYR